MNAERPGKAGPRRFGVSLTAGSLIGLAAGIAVGIAVHATSSPMLEVFAAVVEPLGGLWTHALLMTVLPLVLSQLITAGRLSAARSATSQWLAVSASGS